MINKFVGEITPHCSLFWRLDPGENQPPGSDLRHEKEEKIGLREE
jgi:hypothetical protein